MNAKRAFEEAARSLKEPLRQPQVKPRTLPEVHETFAKWMELPDPGVVTLTLAAVAANKIEGDALWMLLIAPPSSGKTEILDSLLGLPNTFSAGTMTEAALLSGVAKKDVVAGANGGLLRSIGDFGILIAKDFGTILSMNRDARSGLLAALREVFDGHWTRSLGTDGGRSLSWRGKCVLLGGATPIIDEHHSVMASLGERFLLCRMPHVDPRRQALSALSHAGKEATMRAELREAVAGLFLNFEPRAFEIGGGTMLRLSSLSTLVACARSAVVRDSYKREIDLVPGSESPARLALSLARLLHGLRMLGVDDAEGWRLITKIATDCLPDLRRRVFECLQGKDEPVSTTDISLAVGYPTITVRRALEDLAAHSVLTRWAQGQGKADTWELSLFSKQLAREAGLE